MNRLARRNSAAVLAAAVVIAVAASAGLAWGAAGHRMAAREAARLVSPELRGFVDANIESILGFANEPDVVAETDKAEGPNHFFDLDAFGQPPFDEIPATQAAFVERFGAEALAKGRLPWAAAERYRELVTAFKGRDYEAAIRNSGWLAHYVADSAMPLHATKNYKGQETGNVIFDNAGPDRHVHVRYEIGVIEANRRDIAERIGAMRLRTRPIGDPAASIIANLKDSYRLVDPILEADRKLLAPGEAVEPAYYRSMYEELTFITVGQVAYATQQIASFWQSAWEEAGKPGLPAAEVVLQVRPRVSERDRPDTPGDTEKAQ
jgi:hypothetical protein